MRRILGSLLLFWCLVARGAYTEFYVQTTGSNLNSGSTTGNGATYTGTGDSDGTSVFTPNDGSTPASSVNVGDFASVYVTSGATVAVFVGRVTVVAAGANGAITCSTTAKSGTFPASSAGAHTITCKVGGAWAGPSGAVAFPFNFAAAAMTDSTPHSPRINFKAGTTYNVTAAIVSAQTGPLIWEGYTSSPGDGGQFTIDGGATGTAYAVLSFSNPENTLTDCIVNHNGNTGTSEGASLVVSSSTNTFIRCVFANSRDDGFYSSSGQSTCIECEAYGNCNSNQTGFAGMFIGNAGGKFIRCFSHDNATANGNGFKTDQQQTMLNCIAANNGGKGLYCIQTGVCTIEGCDFYNNTSDGILFTTAATTLGVVIENCNFLKNGGIGINATNLQKSGLIRNCGFGTGTQANTGGDIVAGLSVTATGTVTYASGVTPWSAPSTGDFRIVSSAANGTGVGSFTQTGNGMTGTVAYPDVGSAQHRHTQISSGASN
jgi:hypothetical protein